MNGLAFILALLASGNEPLVVEQSADWLEINHVGTCEYDAVADEWKDRESLCQVIWWRGPGRKT